MHNTKINFIYWFAHYNIASPSVRYRAKYPLIFFKENFGVSYYFVVPGYFPKKIYYFLRAYISALFFRKTNSLIVIQRVQSNFIYAKLLKLLVLIRRKDTVYDIDDADYFEMNPNTMYFFAKKCDKISAGSNAIAEHLSQFNKKITITTSPTVDLKVIKTHKNSIFTIGWIGSFAGEHKDSLIDLVFPAIKNSLFKIKFAIIGVLNTDDKLFIENYFKEDLNIEVEVPLDIDWNNEEDIQNKIVAFDIGIATLFNNKIQVAKSGIKAKQYMNNGIPVLSTNLPENNTVVIDGKNGFYCSTPNEFKDRINDFYLMANEEYLQFSINARESISNFNHTKYFNYFEKIKNLK